MLNSELDVFRRLNDILFRAFINRASFFSTMKVADEVHFKRIAFAALECAFRHVRRHTHAYETAEQNTALLFLSALFSKAMAPGSRKLLVYR